MQSAWNSWPHGNLITLLTPSKYSSRQTTHSTCRPIYFLHSAEKPPAFFSNSARRAVRELSDGVMAVLLGTWKLALSITPVVVLERGRDLGWVCCSRGVVGVGGVGEGRAGERHAGDGASVWYVRTGSWSTTDLGALHRLLRILARRMRSA